jgi:hypothetical protein
MLLLAARRRALGLLFQATNYDQFCFPATFPEDPMTTPSGAAGA